MHFFMDDDHVVLRSMVMVCNGNLQLVSIPPIPTCPNLSEQQGFLELRGVGSGLETIQ